MSSFVERDLLLRLIKQLAEVLARALALAAQKQPDLAKAELQQGCTTLLGMDYRSLALVDAASAAALLGDRGRVLVFARLLEGLADVAQTASDARAEQSHTLHALEVVNEVLRCNPQHTEAVEAHARLSTRLTQLTASNV